MLKLSSLKLLYRLVFSELELALASVASELAFLAFSELCLMLASVMMVKLMLRQL